MGNCHPRWLAILILFFLFPATSLAQEADSFFRQNCISCHTIGGGRLAGPDLRGVSDRRDPAWLIEFIQNPKAVIDRGDPYALDLLQQSRNVVMPTVAGMTANLAGVLLDLIDKESALENSQFAGLQFSDRPFTAEDVARGRAIFLGTGPLLNGGPACIGCHTMKGLGGLSGGRLGPDLSRVYQRLRGRTNLAAWLFAPATQTMQPLFQGHALDSEEILSLVANFEAAAKGGGQDFSVAMLGFLVLAIAGSTLILLFFHFAWKWRFRAVRAPLVGHTSLDG